MPTVAVSRSARDLLVEWANRQDPWVRAIVGEALLSRRDLSPAAIAKVTESFLVEKQLVEGEALDAPALGADGGEEDAVQALNLVSLRDCCGVNALAEDQVIEFNPKMTILFGENATGKTGYVRVLKRVANVRSAEQIIPDIHRATPPPKLQATIRYSLDGDATDLPWGGETGIAPLTRMSVFDSPAVALHLEDNLTYVYTPPDLALFRYVHTAIEAVRSALDKERTDREPRQNPFMTAFKRDTSVYPKIEQLGATTDLSELEALAAVGENERAEIDALQINIEALSGQSTSGGLEMLRNRIAVLQAMARVTSAAEQFSRDELADALTHLRVAQDAHHAAATAIFGAEPISEDARPHWERFVEAGDQYLHAAGMDAYPHDGDACIYCRQDLGASAVALLKSYREFASGTAARALDGASGTATAAKAALMTPAIETALATLHTLLPAMEEADKPAEWTAEARVVVDGVDTMRQRLAAPDDDGTPLPVLTVPAAFNERVGNALAEAQAALEAVEGDAKSRETLLAEQRARLGMLEARVTLTRLMPEIRTFVENSAWATRLKLLLGRFQGLLKSLTDVSKTASNEVLNESFRTAFYEECQALRAPNVELGFPGRRGQAARRKTVASDHSLVEVLSEGEQKVIAVADFLAEASFRGGSAPLIFDDPVTSLDHRRLHEMVRRIVRLTDEHQVVVFTHNVWFASELLAEFDHRLNDCSFYQVKENGGVKGLLSGGTHPRIDTPARIKGRINKGIQDARAASDENQTSEVEATYDHIRAWCEAVVETDLLGQVTRRYQPNVAMQNLDRIKPDRLSAAIAVIHSIFERACRYIPGHSQPIETLDVRPTIEELERDWLALQDAQKAYAAD